MRLIENIVNQEVCTVTTAGSQLGYTIQMSSPNKIERTKSQNKQETAGLEISS